MIERSYKRFRIIQMPICKKWMLSHEITFLKLVFNRGTIEHFSQRRFLTRLDTVPNSELQIACSEK